MRKNCLFMIPFEVAILVWPQYAALGQTSVTKSGGAFENYGSGNGWYTPSNAGASDYYYTRSQIWGMSNSSYLKVTDFGFTIPAGSTINGILVEVQLFSDDYTIADNSMRIIKGGTITGNDEAHHIDYRWPTSETFGPYYRYGGSLSLWGVPWTSSDINDSGFGFAFSAKNTFPLPDAQGIAYVDHIRITVFYTPPPRPPAPTLALPVNAATNVSTSPTLSWDASTGATSYRLQVSTSSSFSTAFDWNGITSTSQSVNGLTTSSTYYWHVTATNAGGTSAWSETSSFSTIPAAPAAPTLASPADGVANVATSPTLSWNACVEASSYRLQVSASSTFSTTVVDQSGITSTSQSISGLANNTTYYWRVNATNAGGTSDWSTTWSFTTEPRRYTITVCSPSNGSISPSGPVSVIEGSSQAFSMTPNGCYGISDVTVDGVSVGAVGSYMYCSPKVKTIFVDDWLSLFIKPLPASGSPR